MIGVKLSDLAAALVRKRKAEGLSLKQVEALTGVSASTLSRLESAVGKPDAETLIKLTDWIELPLARILNEQDRDGPVIYSPGEPTPDIVEAHLKKDRSLTPKAAQALSNLFRTAYEEYRKVKL